ncbi:hypothetical protein BDV41DRAFT_581947 [Aspergillus transmontanensis]|uniref:FAD-binding domain-containing protein n=1 Tax=Aspergillus transmontanensis TaxID=1034304 RepID=A0A5N6VHK9_9EURO|nr:hypothetical protein BDV41DRAFT_581947 [Aspergillus transmontanensis]
METTTATAPSRLRIAIVGGGIAGLTAAIALQKHPQVDVQIYERAKEFKEIGASIGISPNGLRTLEKMGVESAFNAEVCSRQKSDWPMIFRHWKTGEIIGYDTHRTVKTKKHFTSRYHRAHLQQALLENVQSDIVHLNKRFVTASVDPTVGVILEFADGTTATADICLGADGIHSGVRKAFVPHHTLHWTGWVAFRAAFDASLVNTVEFPEDAAHWVGHDRTFFHSYLGKGQFTTVGAFNADPQDPSAPYRTSQWNEEGSLDVLKEYYKDWHPSVRSLVEATPYTKVYPNVAGAPLDQWTFFDRVALLGDAAHTHGGAFAAGGSLAIDDAYCFSLALFYIFPPTATEKPSPEKLKDVFRLYEATRKSHVDKVLRKVHEVIKDQKKSVERGSTETDDELRERVRTRFDPWWISEHDVEAAFWGSVKKLEFISHL